MLPKHEAFGFEIRSPEKEKLDTVLEDLNDRIRLLVETEVVRKDSKFVLLQVRLEVER